MVYLLCLMFNLREGVSWNRHSWAVTSAGNFCVSDPVVGRRRAWGSCSNAYPKREGLELATSREASTVLLLRLGPFPLRFR
jgi:hypothetical protein